MYKLIHASAHQLPMIPDCSIHMIATSPPFYGLRKYAGEQDVEWPTVEYSPMPGLPPVKVQGCEPACEHEWTIETKSGKYNWEEYIKNGEWDREQQKDRASSKSFICARCGGWRGPLGLEPDPFAYIGHLILCLREWRRVLRDDGTIFINLGDSYAGSWGNSGHRAELDGGESVQRTKATAYFRRNGYTDHRETPPSANVKSVREKSLLGIPWRFAFAAEAEGWILRRDIIWAKGISFCPTHSGSSMPESVDDRPSSSHEYVFLLAKQPNYYFDMQAIREPSFSNHPSGNGYKREPRQSYLDKNGPRGNAEQWQPDSGSRNVRSVWAINPKPSRQAHFAVWPETLVRPMIQAGTSQEGCCPICGAPWERVEKRGEPVQQHWAPGTQEKIHHAQGTHGATSVMNTGYTSPKITIGWHQTCKCPPARPVPCTVLDPFSGSGSTLAAAESLTRNAIGVDISEVYLEEVATERCGLFNEAYLEEGPTP